MFNIYFKIDILLSKYRLSQRQVALECNIRPSTLKMYADNSIQRVNVVDLESLYNFFHQLDDRIILSDLIDIKETKPDLSKFITEEELDKLL